MRSVFRVGLACSFVVLQGLVVQAGEINRTFKGVKQVSIETISGDCIVEKVEGEVVRLVVTYTFDEDTFDPEIQQHGDRLMLEERFRGDTNRGRSTWRLSVPEKTDIRFSTASGDLRVSALRSTIDASTASGDVELSNMEGEFEVSTASGDIEAKKLSGRIRISTASGDVLSEDVSGDCKINTASGNVRASGTKGEIRVSTASGDIELESSAGTFDVSAASGDVQAVEITIEEESSFSAASGDVEVSLGNRLAHDIKLSSASGDAVLNFNKYPIKGFIKMTAKAGRNRIKAPFEFDHEETYYKWGDEYVTKSATRGSDRPRIEIRTASGKAVLLER